MEKLKKNRIWLTVIGFGIVIVVILLMMLHQQKQATPEAQEASYSSSVKASSISQDAQDTDNEKAYAKKAATMKGHVFQELFTTWNKDDFRKWANSYNSLSDEDKYKASSYFGTSAKYYNLRTDKSTLSNIADSILQNDFKSISYFDTVKEFNKAYPAVDPDTIKK
ncbi:hypothetical protein [Leuconostoc pseudomesenteroides]|uniref:hypothetical protein n=1 Tax=Leuconostoc pseudomesenteroides TaxID=33968 RepID=UPI0032DFF575